MVSWWIKLSMAGMVACLLGAEASAQTVILALRSEGVAYHIESFGRRLDLRLAVVTGISAREECSSIDPEDVVLVLRLPGGTSLVSETHGGAVYDVAAGTVTWNLGTLDALVYCFGGVRIGATVDVDPLVAAGTMLTATASVTTSTPGDDGADNEVTETFQGGMLPLDVFVESDSRCDAGSDDSSSDIGEALACADSDPGILPADASAAVGSMGGPRLLGVLTTPGGGIVAPKLRVRASSDGGFDCDPTLTSCWALGISAEATVTQDVEVHNPNPFEVPLHLRRDVYAHAACSDNDAFFPGSAFVEDSIPSVECGSSYDNDVPHGVLHLLCDGITNTCVREGVVTTNEPEKLDDTFSSSLARVPGFGARTIRSEFGSGDARGDSRVFDFGAGLLVIRSGYGLYNAASQVEVALAGGTSSLVVGELRFRAESPVDLLVTDESGDRVGRAPDETAPDPGDGVDVVPGIQSVAEIPGSHYSGSSTEPEEIVIGIPDAGRYRLDVAGSGDGPFRITAESLAPDGLVLTRHVFTGEATSGSLLSREFVLEPDGTLSLASSSSLPCDADDDSDVDRDDLVLILAARGTLAEGPDDPRDADGDGTITVLDARKCVLACTLPRCAAN